MPDDAKPSPEWADQAEQQLQALRSAGVQWLPKPDAKKKLHFEPPAADLFGELDDPAESGDSIKFDPESARIALETLRSEVRGCMKCGELASTRSQTVFGVGPLQPVLCLVGEAPGADEDRLGEPFVGAAGQMLNKILMACGFKREEVYICNTIKCRPPGNRTPAPEECANCRPYLLQQLELVRPQFYCALGGVAAAQLLQTKESLGRLRGKLHSVMGVPAIVTYHPSYILPHRSPEKKKDVWEDMKFMLGHMGRPIPGPSKG